MSRNVRSACKSWTSGIQLTFQPTSSFSDLRVIIRRRRPAELAGAPPARADHQVERRGTQRRMTKLASARLKSCPLWSESGQRWILAVNCLSANDPKRKWSVHRSSSVNAAGKHYAELAKAESPAHLMSSTPFQGSSGKTSRQTTPSKVCEGRYSRECQILV
jgi:hypothetical protein